MASAGSDGSDGITATSFGAFTALIPAKCPPDAPVICLMGWVGASDKALSKYAELVAAEGYASVRSTQPTPHLFSPIQAPRRRWALSLLNFLKDQGLCPPRRLVLWAFSNGGGSVVEQIVHLAATEREWSHLQQLIVGFIFDSAPGYFHPYMSRRVLQTEMPPGILRSLWIAGVGVVMRLDNLLAGSTRAERYWAAMRAVGSDGKPQLFVYSADDHLCDVKKLEELIAEKKQLGQNVTAVPMPLPSAHVTHLKLHPQQYREAVLHQLDVLRRVPLAIARL